MTKLWLVTLLSVLTIEPALQAQGTPPAEPGTIQGIVTRAGTTEPLSGAQVTLQGGAADPQALQVLLNTAASQGIVVTPAPGASTSDAIQALADAAAARGLPLTVERTFNRSWRPFPERPTDNDLGPRRRVHV